MNNIDKQYWDILTCAISEPPEPTYLPKFDEEQSRLFLSQAHDIEYAEITIEDIFTLSEERVTTNKQLNMSWEVSLNQFECFKS